MERTARRAAGPRREGSWQALCRQALRPRGEAVHWGSAYLPRAVLVGRQVAEALERIAPQSRVAAAARVAVRSASVDEAVPVARVHQHGRSLAVQAQALRYRRSVGGSVGPARPCHRAP